MTHVRRARLASIFAGVLTAALLSPISTAHAEPLTVSNVFAFRADRTANPLGFLASSIVIGANGVTPNPLNSPGPVSDGTLTTVIASQAGTQVPLNKIITADPTFRNSYVSQVPYDPNLTGAWNVTVSNPTTSPVELNRSTAAFGNVAAVPFVSSMSLSGSGSTLAVNWAQPGENAQGEVDRQTIFVFRQNPNGSYTLVHSAELGKTARTYDLTPLNLTVGTNYVLSIDTSEFGGGNSTQAISSSYFAFVPSVNQVNAFLPSVSEPGVYEFNVDVDTPNEVIFIDPDVAVGFDFAIGPGDPNFASVVLPSVGDDLFSLWLFDTNGDPYDSLQTLTAGVAFDFLTEVDPLGVSMFRILGIETSAMLDPGNPLAFQAGVSFVRTGQFTGSMKAITEFVPEPVPEPTTMALIGGGLCGMVLRRWRRGARARA
jgi:hypothetical protein